MKACPLYLLLALTAATATEAATPMPAEEPPTAAERQDTIAKKRKTPGSADVVGEDRMNKGLVTNSLEALSGQSAGVTVSSGESQMAMLSSVRVRGTTSLTGGNDPLIIIDGVYSDIATLSSIYPSDIESFTILRNAAETAPYGSRGASGVIQVTTKKGHSGRFHISYDGNVGFESAYKNIEMLGRDEYIGTAKKLGLSYNDGGHDTNFAKSLTRTGLVQNHHVALSGGNEQSNYRASLAYMSHNMVVKVNKTDNFVAKIDLRQKAFGDRMTIDMGVFGSSQSNHFIFDEQKLFYSAAAQNPTFPAGMSQNGSWDKNSTASQINPPGALMQEKNDEKNQNFNSHLQVAYDFGHGLTAKAFGSYSYTSAGNGMFTPTWVWAQGQIWRGERKTEDWLANLEASYSHDWGPHRLQATLLGEFQSTKLTGFQTSARGITTNQYGYDNIAGAAFQLYGMTSSDYERANLASFMAGASYTLSNRYTLSANMRADGSSMFASGNKWGIFPSVSASWDVKAEKWLKDISWLNMLKLRTSYGLTGNLAGIASYNSMQLFHPTGVVPWNGGTSVTYGQQANYNPNLKWETRSTFNIGADVALWDNRVVFTAEYYYSLTRDMLYQYDVPTPPFTYPKLLANLGKMSNSGFELGLGVTPLRTNDMELNVNVNLSFQKNKLKSLSGNYNGMHLSANDMTSIGSLNGAGFHGGYNDIVYQIVGQPLGVFYLPHCTGLEKRDDGSYHYRIADLDGNGAVNIEDGGDRYIAGQATPKATLGSNISFRYKDFDIAVQMNGAFGHKIYNATALAYMNMTSFPDYNVMKGAPEANITDQTATDYWLEDGDYLNFDYVTVGWNVPRQWLGSVVSALRVSLSVNNLATITGYSGLTPMINSYVVNGTLGLDDKRSYPPYRSYSIGVSIQF